MFDNTIKIYREAVSFLIGCFNKEWDSIQKVEGAKSRKSFAEKLIHTTKYSTAKYDFDAKFYKFPSYLRRAAIQAALGSVSSYYKILVTLRKERSHPRKEVRKIFSPLRFRGEGRTL